MDIKIWSRIKMLDFINNQKGDLSCPGYNRYSIHFKDIRHFCSDG